MAVVVIGHNPGVTAEQFEALQRQLNVATNPPKGAVAQLAGPVEGG